MTRDPRLVAVATLAFARYAAYIDEAETAAELALSAGEAAQHDEGLSAWATLVHWTTAAPTTAPSSAMELRDRASAMPAPQAGGLMAAWGAAASLAIGLPEETRAWLAIAARHACAGPARLLALEVSANLAVVEERFEDASSALQEAMALAKEGGWKRAHAKLELRFGTHVAPRLDGVSPMRWISRAAPDLLLVGTWQDRSALRDALHEHGRRMADHVMSETAARPLGRLNRAVGSLRMDTLLAVMELVRKRSAREKSTARWESDATSYLTLLDRVGALSSEVAEVETDLTELVGEALVARDRTALMVSAIAELDGIKQPSELANAGARIAGDFVGAVQAWVAERASDGSLRVIGAHPPEKEPPRDWTRLVEGSEPPAGTAERLPRRRASLGPTMAVVLDAPPFRGALLLDKGHSDRRFREDDRMLATLLGVQLAHGLARMRSRAAERVAHTRLAATFEAIRDGVVAVDARGCVRSANAAAARMLRMHDRPLVGASLSQIDTLEPLWRVLSTSARVDNTVVRLPYGTVVVTSRPVGVPDDGMVATLVELGRAE